ncbi:hypothetical protein [Cryptosporangium minutisporangium]|uniref:hypothetical protein n=1 Tax=Cryptosporangium minutisporangium TaxID=113569 RepID=UPI0031E9921D
MIAAVVRAVAGPLALFLLIGWFWTPDPFAVWLLTASVVAFLGAVGPLRRAWLGWVRTGRLRPA